MKLNHKTTMSLAAAMGCLAMSVNTASAALTNVSFEDGTWGASTASHDSFNPVGWSTNPSDAWRPRASLGSLNPTDGSFQTWMNSGTFAYQDSGETIVAGTTYELKISLGADQGNFSNIESTVIRLYGSDAGTGTALAEITPNGPATTVWTEQTVSFVATGAQATGQTLGVYFGVTGGTQAEWDNVRLTITPVPEPTTTALLGLGGLALILRRRK